MSKTPETDNKIRKSGRKSIPTSKTTMETDLLDKIATLNEIIEKKDNDILKIQGELLIEQKKVADIERKVIDVQKLQDKFLNEQKKVVELQSQVESLEQLQQKLSAEQQKVLHLQRQVDDMEHIQEKLSMEQQKVNNFQREVHNLEKLIKNYSKNEESQNKNIGGLQTKVDEQRKKINELLAVQTRLKEEKIGQEKNHSKPQKPYSRGQKNYPRTKSAQDLKDSDNVVYSALYQIQKTVSDLSSRVTLNTHGNQPVYPNPTSQVNPYSQSMTSPAMMHPFMPSMPDSMSFPSTQSNFPINYPNAYPFMFNRY